jgi:hypothetical protein
MRGPGTLNLSGRHTKILFSQLLVAVCHWIGMGRSGDWLPSASSVTIPFSNIIGRQDTYR